MPKQILETDYAEHAPLGEGDILQEGDESFDDDDGWIPVNSSSYGRLLGKVEAKYIPYRRSKNGN